MKNRAQRRADREKALKKAFERTTQNPRELWCSEEQRERWAYTHYKHPQRCSCICCGNPRRFFKGEERFTVAERRQQVKALDLSED